MHFHPYSFIPINRDLINFVLFFTSAQPQLLPNPSEVKITPSHTVRASLKWC